MKILIVYIILMGDELSISDIYDPIMAEKFVDPVVAMDGITYERKSIVSWFKRSAKSPVTGVELKSRELITNVTFRNAIESYDKVLKDERFNSKKKEEEYRRRTAEVLYDVIMEGNGMQQFSNIIKLYDSIQRATCHPEDFLQVCKVSLADYFMHFMSSAPKYDISSNKMVVSIFRIWKEHLCSVNPDGFAEHTRERISLCLLGSTHIELTGKQRAAKFILATLGDYAFITEMVAHWFESHEKTLVLKCPPWAMSLLNSSYFSKRYEKWFFGKPPPLPPPNRNQSLRWSKHYGRVLLDWCVGDIFAAIQVTVPQAIILQKIAEIAGTFGFITVKTAIELTAFADCDFQMFSAHLCPLVCGENTLLRIDGKINSTDSRLRANFDVDLKLLSLAKPKFFASLCGVCANVFDFADGEHIKNYNLVLNTVYHVVKVRRGINLPILEAEVILCLRPRHLKQRDILYLIPLTLRELIQKEYIEFRDGLYFRLI